LAASCRSAAGIAFYAVMAFAPLSIVAGAWIFLTDKLKSRVSWRRL
jgi:hypothetical protein